MASFALTFNEFLQANTCSLSSADTCLQAEVCYPGVYSLSMAFTIACCAEHDEGHMEPIDCDSQSLQTGVCMERACEMVVGDTSKSHHRNRAWSLMREATEYEHAFIQT